MELKLDGVMVWVGNVPATVAFYEQAFGRTVQMMNEEKTYAQMSTGETTLSFAHEGAAQATGVQIRPNREKDVAPAFQLALVSKDVDAAFAQATKAGAQVAVAVVEKPWGQHLGYLRDLNGLLVELSSPAAW